MKACKSTVVLLVALTFLTAPSPAAGRPGPETGARKVADSGGRPPPIEQLPPQQQEQVRKNYQKFKNLPPQEQERIQKNFREWQQLSPEERQRLQKQYEERNPQASPGPREAPGR